MAIFVTKKAIIAGAIEAPPGTAVSLASADANLRVTDITVTPTIGAYILDESKGYLGERGAVTGTEQVEIGFTAALSAGTALGTPPVWMKYAMLCGARQYAEFTLSADLITSNSTAATVLTYAAGGTTTSTAITPVVFSGTHAATMSAIAAALVTAGGSGTVATVDNRTIYIYHPTKRVGLSGVAVTLGASQPTVTLRTYVRDNSATLEQTGTIARQLVPQSGNAVQDTGKGMIGNMVVSQGAIGEPLLAAFSFLGPYTGKTDAAAFSLTGQDDTFPPRTVGGVTTDGGVTQHISNISLDTGNDLQLKEAGTATAGYLQGYIANNAPRLTFNPQLFLQATDASYTRWSAGTQSAFVYSTAVRSGQKITIRVPVMQIMEMGDGERNGEAILEKTAMCCLTTGNYRWEISVEA